MADPILSRAGSGRWLFEGELGFASVPAVLKASSNCFDNGPDVEIDLKGVTRADSAGLAVLLEWLRQAQRSGKRVTFTNVPKQLREIAGLCGLETIISFNNER